VALRVTFNMKKLYIIGAGPFGRELLGWLKQDSIYTNQFYFAGFLDNRNSLLDNYIADYKIVGDPYNFTFSKNDFCLIGVADPFYKCELIKNLKNHTSIISFVSSNAIISPTAKIGVGSIISPWVSISNDTNIGKYVTIMIGTKIGHDCDVQQFSSLMADVKLAARVNINKKVYIGLGAILINDISIGNSSIVGAGSVVLKSCKDQITIFGNPAKQIKSK
tara:strand:+ start:415 stop:1074 length:660 start_codon:yes stop_codon:yes gene_type:complete